MEIRDTSVGLWAGKDLAQTLRKKGLCVEVLPAKRSYPKTVLHHHHRATSRLDSVARHIRGAFETMVVIIGDEDRMTIDYAYSNPLQDGQKSRAFMNAIRQKLGTTYEWGGRESTHHPGLSCMGLIFTAYCQVTGRAWASLSTNAGELVRDRTFGPVVAGPWKASAVDYSQLRAGDIIYFAASDVVTPKDIALPGLVDQKPVKTVHMGVYSGGVDRKFIHSNPMRGVVEQPLEGWAFKALLATRPFPQ